MSKLGKVVTVAAAKGGVGKSTISRFLAIALNEMGYSSVIIDLCQNSSVSTGFLRNRDEFEYTVYDWLTGTVPPSKVIQQHQDTNIYYFPSNETVDDFEAWAEKNYTAVKRLNSIANKVKPLKEMFDFIIFDTHPSENSDLVSYALASSDFCLIPMEVDRDSLLGAIRIAEIVDEFKEQMDIDYGIVPNKVSTTNGKIRSQLEDMKKELSENGINALFPVVRYTDVISTTKNENVMLNETENLYAKRVMQDFHEVKDELLKRLNINAKEEVLGHE